MDVCVFAGVCMCVYVSVFKLGILQVWKEWKSNYMFLIVPSISITSGKCIEETQNHAYHHHCQCWGINTICLSPHDFLPGQKLVQDNQFSSMTVDVRGCLSRHCANYCFFILKHKKQRYSCIPKQQFWGQGLKHIDSHYDQWFLHIFRSQIIDKLYPRSYFFQL